LISAGAPPQTPLGSSQRSLRPPGWILGSSTSKGRKEREREGGQRKGQKYKKEEKRGKKMK